MFRLSTDSDHGLYMLFIDHSNEYQFAIEAVPSFYLHDRDVCPRIVVYSNIEKITEWVLICSWTRICFYRNLDCAPLCTDSILFVKIVDLLNILIDESRLSLKPVVGIPFNSLRIKWLLRVTRSVEILPFFLQI